MEVNQDLDRPVGEAANGETANERLRARLHENDADVSARDVRFGRAGTVSFESLRSELGQNSVRNHQHSVRILSEFVGNPEI